MTDRRRRSMVARSSSTPVFEPDAVDPIDPATLDGVGGLSIKIFDPSNASYRYTTSAESTLAVADDPVGSIKDTLGSGTAFTTGTPSLRPTLRSDGTRWWLEVSGSQALSVAGSSGSFNYLHDGTGGEWMAGARFGTTANPNTLYMLIDNTNGSLGNVGFSCYFDDRSSLPRNNQIHHLITKGITLQPVKNSSYDNAVNANQDCVVGGSYINQTGDEMTFNIDGNVVHSPSINPGTTSNANNSLILFRNSGAASNYMTGRLYYLCIIDGVLTEAQRAGVDAFIATKAPKSANETKLHSFDAGSRVEWFIDQTNIDSSSGLDFDVQRLSKHASNPLSEPSGTNTATWDYDKYYTSVLHDGTTYKAWVGAAGGDTPWDDAQAAYMTSSDGLTWTKPNLGLVTWDGSTNNNLIQLGYDTTAQYDGSEYVIMQGAPLGGGSVGDEVGRIYSSADGITSFTLEKTLDPASFHPGLFQFEFHGMTLRSDGRWVAYYTFNHDADRRSIAAYVSDTSDPSGAWAHNGLLTGFAAFDDTTQFYNFSASLINGVLYGIAVRFDDISERMWLDLYTSPGDDGINFTPRKGNILSHGRIGDLAYDGGMVGAKSILDNGSEVQVFYTGSVQRHEVGGILRDSRLCLARLASGRLGVLSGAGGTVTTTAFTATESLKINAKSTGENLKVELLDPADDSVLTGYAKADCDNLDGNYLAKVVTWGGLSIPTDQSVKLKFYLDS